MTNYFQALNESLNAEPYQTELDPNPPANYVVYYFKEDENGKTYRIQFIKKPVIGKQVWVMFVNEKTANIKTFKKILTKFKNPQRVITTIIGTTRTFLDEYSATTKGIVFTLPTNFFGNYIGLVQKVIQREFKSKLQLHSFEDTVTPPKVAEQDYDNVIYLYTTVKPYKFDSVYNGKWFVDAMAAANKSIQDVKPLDGGNVNKSTDNVAKPEDTTKISIATDKRVSPYKSQTNKLISDIKQAVKNNEAAKHKTTSKDGKIFIDHPENVWAVQTIDSIVYPVPMESDSELEGYYFDQKTGGLSTMPYNWDISQVKGVIKPTGVKATNPLIQSMAAKTDRNDQ